MNALEKVRAAYEEQGRLVETLTETLAWVRKNYASGSTAEINSRIDATLAKARQS